MSLEGLFHKVGNEVIPEKSNVPDGELEIVWTQSIDELDYVRSSRTVSMRRKGEIKYRSSGDYYTTIGYSVLDEDTEPTQIHHTTPMYERRIFLLKDPGRGLKGDPV